MMPYGAERPMTEHEWGLLDKGTKRMNIVVIFNIYIIITNKLI